MRRSHKATVEKLDPGKEHRLKHAQSLGKDTRKCMQQTEKVVRSSSKQKTLLADPNYKGQTDT